MGITVSKKGAANGAGFQYNYHYPDMSKMAENHEKEGVVSLAFVSTNKKDKCYLVSTPLAGKDGAVASPAAGGTEAPATANGTSGDNKKPAKAVNWVFFNDSHSTQFDITVTFFHGSSIKVLGDISSTRESQDRLVVTTPIAPGQTLPFIEGPVSGYLWKATPKTLEITEEMKRIEREAKQKIKEEQKLKKDESKEKTKTKGKDGEEKKTSKKKEAASASNGAAKEASAEAKGEKATSKGAKKAEKDAAGATSNTGNPAKEEAKDAAKEETKEAAKTDDIKDEVIEGGDVSAAAEKTNEAKENTSHNAGEGKDKAEEVKEEATEKTEEVKGEAAEETKEAAKEEPPAQAAAAEQEKSEEAPAAAEGGNEATAAA